MTHNELAQDTFFWALQCLCSMHRKPFSVELALQQLAAPYTVGSFEQAAQAYGLDASLRKCKPGKLHKESFPLVAWLSVKAGPANNAELSDAGEKRQAVAALVLQADENNVLVVEPGDAAPLTMSLEEFAQRYLGQVTRIARGRPCSGS